MKYIIFNHDIALAPIIKLTGVCFFYMKATEKMISAQMLLQSDSELNSATSLTETSIEKTNFNIYKNTITPLIYNTFRIQRGQSS